MMIILLLLLLISFPSSISAEWNYIPFDDAMKKDAFPQIYTRTKEMVEMDCDVLYDFFKNLYEQHCFLHTSTDSAVKIPKIIHQIWLGSEVPESLKILQKTWIDYHANRGWTYKLWTDEDVAQLKLYNQEFYDASDNYGVKSDILRWELLYYYGGIYVDMDYECLQPLDALLCYDFYTALQPLDTEFVQLGAALCGSRPGHPILKHCIETIKDDWHLKCAIRKTGPIHFTKSFYACAGKDGNKDIAFPAFYFYPLGCQERTYFFPLDGDNRKSWKQNGAFAIHWWAKSWMPKSYRSQIFRDTNNDASTASWNN
jgi:inositol phosphorylceramide mannosyltransferase catalytic subunit